MEPDLAGYKIYYRTSAENYDVYIDVGKETRCTISNLQEGRTYLFAAKAYDLDGNESGFSAELSCTILRNPRELTLAWDPNTEPGLAGYRIYYGTSSRDYQYYIDVGNQTSCMLAEFTEDSTYFFAVTAYDLNGNESDFSNEVILIVR